MLSKLMAKVKCSHYEILESYIRLFLQVISEGEWNLGFSKEALVELTLSTHLYIIGFFWWNLRIDIAQVVAPRHFRNQKNIT